MKTNFFICPVCGNVVMKLVDSGVVPSCCGQEMRLMEPNAVDASLEKHVPQLSRTDKGELLVQIGSEPHPMTNEHRIQFVYVETEKGGQLRYFKPDQPASIEVCDCDDSATAVYAYCNLHGLWENNQIPF